MIPQDHCFRENNCITHTNHTKKTYCCCDYVAEDHTGCDCEEEARAMQDCEVCKGKCYVICKRDDGHLAIERCDMCSYGVLTDEDAAHFYIKDGGACSTSYPCYITIG